VLILANALHDMVGVNSLEEISSTFSSSDGSYYFSYFSSYSQFM
jgi:hypothetical protein